MAAGKVTATITAKVGPGLSVSSLAIPNVSSINFNFEKGVFSVFCDADPKQQDFEYSDIATVTIDPAAKTVTIST